MFKIVIKKSEIFKEERLILDLKRYYEVKISKYHREIGGEKFWMVEIDTFDVDGDDTIIIRSVLDLSLGGDPDIRIIG